MNQINQTNKTIIMKHMKYFAIAIGICLLSIFGARAASTNVTLTANTTNLVLGAGANIYSVKLIQGANAGTATYTLFDSGTAGVNTYTNAAYTNYTTIVTNISDVITNSQGFLQTNIYPGKFTYATSVAANTNQLPVLATFAMTANTTETLIQNIVTTRGLVIKASGAGATNGSVIVTYQPAYTTP